MNARLPAGPLLTVDELRSGYGRVPILHGVSLEVGVGEIVGILGHNGMGKSTLLRTIMGFLPTTSGRIDFDGQTIDGFSTTARSRAGIGYVPQGREIFSALSVLENLRIGCGGSRNGEADAIDEVLSLFPRLKAYLDRPGGALSGGEQQLLALARCLCGYPKLVILDEPTEGIQPSIVQEMIVTLHAVGRSRGLAILLVEQNLGFIATLARRIMVLQKGAITAEITPEEARDPEAVHAFFGMA